jgi:hypothetical protein
MQGGGEKKEKKEKRPPRRRRSERAGAGKNVIKRDGGIAGGHRR